MTMASRTGPMHGRTVTEGEQFTSVGVINDEGWNPNVNEGQKISEVAKIKQEIMEFQHFVGVPTTGKKSNDLLYK